MAIVATALAVTSQALSEWLAPSATVPETVVADSHGLAAADAISPEAAVSETSDAASEEVASLTAADTSWESDIDQDIGLLSQRIDVLEEELPLEVAAGLSNQSDTSTDQL